MIKTLEFQFQILQAWESCSGEFLEYIKSLIESKKQHVPQYEKSLSIFSLRTRGKFSFQLGSGHSSRWHISVRIGFLSTEWQISFIGKAKQTIGAPCCGHQICVHRGISGMFKCHIHPVYKLRSAVAIQRKHVNQHSQQKEASLWVFGWWKLLRCLTVTLFPGSEIMSHWGRCRGA